MHFIETVLAVLLALWLYENTQVAMEISEIMIDLGLI